MAFYIAIIAAFLSTLFLANFIAEILPGKTLHGRKRLLIFFGCFIFMLVYFGWNFLLVLLLLFLVSCQIVDMETGKSESFLMLTLLIGSTALLVRFWELLSSHESLLTLGTIFTSVLMGVSLLAFRDSRKPIQEKESE